MAAVNIREFMHHHTKYLKEVKSGGHITIMERNTPIADLVPHNENVSAPAWRRPIEKIKLKGETFSTTIVKNRSVERQ
jgi:antitoxin (DNA-binding transcriptional repressor) of toxin-antitoxin stability system